MLNQLINVQNVEMKLEEIHKNSIEAAKISKRRVKQMDFLDDEKEQKKKESQDKSEIGPDLKPKPKKFPSSKLIGPGPTKKEVSSPPSESPKPKNGRKKRGRKRGPKKGMMDKDDLYQAAMGIRKSVVKEIIESIKKQFLG